MIAVKTLLYVG